MSSIKIIDLPFTFDIIVQIYVYVHIFAPCLKLLRKFDSNIHLKFTFQQNENPITENLLYE